MSDEIAGVEANINQHFAAILESSQIDYRVILLSRYGGTSNQSICVDPPLSGDTSCNPPTPSDWPVYTDRFYQYSSKIDSNNELDLILSEYAAGFTKSKHDTPAWGTWIRPNAHYVFLVITDDESDMASDAFDTSLLALTSLTDPTVHPFGTAAHRNYVWHSIIGLKEKANPTDAYLASEPIQNALCTGNGDGVVKPGVQYQNLSILTGGLRFPICQYSSFDAVFQAIAADVVTHVQIACDFAIPDAPAGQTLNLDDVAVQYTPVGGTTTTFGQVLDPSQCAADAFTIDRTANRVYLCPAACDAVQAAPQANLQVVFACSSTILPPR
jgi:hypothetical protein